MMSTGKMTKRYAGGLRRAARRWCAAAVVGIVTAVTAAGLCPDAGAAERGDAESSENRIYDYADLFSAGEESGLEEEIAGLRKDADFDVAVVTTYSTGGLDAQSCADNLYEELELGEGSGHSGILLLIVYDEEAAFSTEGGAIRIFTDDRLETMMDHLVEDAAAGDYLSGVEGFLEDVGFYADRGIVSGQYNYSSETGAVSVHRTISPIEFLLALAVALATAGGAVMTVKRQYNMETDTRQLANQNMAYRADSQFRFTDTSDHLLGSFVTTAVIARAVARSAAGSAGGRSSAGRSTTHHSASGRTHGGTSRKF